MAVPIQMAIRPFRPAAANVLSEHLVLRMNCTAQKLGPAFRKLLFLRGKIKAQARAGYRTKCGSERTSVAALLGKAEHCRRETGNLV